MLPSVLIATTLAGQGVAIASNSSAIQPAIVVTNPRVLEFELPDISNDLALRFRSLPEGLKHLPFPKNPPVEPTSKRESSPAPVPPFVPFGTGSREATPTPPSDSIQERIKALEWGIAALRVNGGSVGSIEMLQKDLDAARRSLKKDK